MEARALFWWLEIGFFLILGIVKLSQE